MWTKRYLPALVGLFSNQLLKPIPGAMETVGAALQSKRGGSSGSEWQEVQNALRFIQSPNPVLFDIGANVGRWSLSMASRLAAEGRSARIHMFEPQPQCWQALESLSLPYTKLNKTAVGDTAGTVAFYQGGNSEVASVYERSDFSGVNDKIEVPCITLDDYIREYEIDIVDYVKMDIEGHEYAALVGSTHSLEERKICSISFEFGGSNVNSRTFYIDFYRFLREKGLDIYRMGHDGVPIHVKDYSRDLEYFNGVANYVASFAEPDRLRRP